MRSAGPECGEGQMYGATRLGYAGICVVLAVSCAAAADVTAPAEPLPPPPPTIWVHGGVLGAFPNTNASPTGGGLFGTQPLVGFNSVFFGQTNNAIRPVYTIFLELGYFITPNFVLALGTAVPPITHFKATGFPLVGLTGTNLLGSARYGEIVLLLQYHFNQFGAFQPYFGAGVGYAINFGNISDGLLRNFYWDQNFAFVLQAGADYMLTPNWGVFVDGKKVFFETDSGGLAQSPVTGFAVIPTRAHVRVDPWVAGVGITFKY
jgi:outer membrane protein